MLITHVGASGLDCGSRVKHCALKSLQTHRINLHRSCNGYFKSIGKVNTSVDMNPPLMMKKMLWWYSGLCTVREVNSVDMQNF